MFKDSLTHVLIVCLSPNEGKDESGQEIPMEHSLRTLSTNIKDFKSLNIPEDEPIDEVEDNISIINSEVEENAAPSTSKSNVTAWLNDIKCDIKDSIEGLLDGRLNPYHAPVVAEEFLRISEKFVLWSGVMVQPFGSPHLTSSSTSVESDFSDLKKNVLRGIRMLLAIPKFISLHIDAIEGSCRLAGAAANDDHNNIPIGEERLNRVRAHRNECQRKISVVSDLNEEYNNSCIEEKFNGVKTSSGSGQKEIIVKTESLEECKSNSIGEDYHNRFASSREACGIEDIINDLSQVENWRGLEEKKGKKQSIYLNPLPELDAAVQAKLLKQPKKRMLKNGNICKTVRMGRDSVLLRNTCAFDAVAQVITAGYVMYKDYRDFVDSSTNLLLNTVKSLATLGATKETYLLRAQALSQVMQPKCTLIMPQTLPKKNSRQSSIRDYDCTINAPSLSRMLMHDSPSITITTVCCTGDNCTRPAADTISVVDTNMNVIQENGLKSLEKSIVSCLRIHTPSESCSNEEKSLRQHQLLACKPPCNGTPTVTLEFGEQLLIDIDYISDPAVKCVNGSANRPYALKEFPVSVKLFGCQFVLVGVIAYTPGHYVGYTRNINGTWKQYNDLSKDVVTVQGDNTVCAHMLCYIKILK